ncbi:MAG: hypothetical protein OEZ33_07160 [Gammaproteobacteria bacterium]|nr:hypothetical protein [Gammaproteobacteria bacterium]MDH5777972.1 hypothetical protein [Gammaproteobacteria bacterium]
MADNSDKRDKLNEDNESMVKALESIKSLLATSEDKLNKARESINQASQFALKSDPDEVPELDDIIIVPRKSATEASEKEPQIDFADTQFVEADPDQELDVDDESFADSLIQLRTELEYELEHKLKTYAARLEEDLKARIQIFIEQHKNKK